MRQNLAQIVKEYTPSLLLILVLGLFALLFSFEYLGLSLLFPTPFQKLPLFWWALAVIAILYMRLRNEHIPPIFYARTPFLSAILLHIFLLIAIASFNLFLNFLPTSLLGVNLLWSVEVLLLFFTLGAMLVFGDLHFIQNSAKKLLWSVLFGTLLFSVILILHSVWIYLSLIVGQVVFFFLSLLFDDTFYIQSSMYNNRYYEGVPTVGAGDFGGVILKTCSGVEGITLFIVLFTFLVLLEWRRIKEWWKIPVLYLSGIATMFFFNIVRVFILILAGITISPDFAAGGLHTNLGWIFFTIVFIFFEFVSYRWMVRR